MDLLSGEKIDLLHDDTFSLLKRLCASGLVGAAGAAARAQPSLVLVSAREALPQFVPLSAGTSGSLAVGLGVVSPAGLTGSQAPACSTMWACVVDQTNRWAPTAEPEKEKLYGAGHVVFSLHQRN